MDYYLGTIDLLGNYCILLFFKKISHDTLASIIYFFLLISVLYIFIPLYFQYMPIIPDYFIQLICAASMQQQML